MRNTLLAFSLVAFAAGSAACAADAEVDATGTKAMVNGQVLDMPAVTSRRHMLFQFGLFGTELHIGWKKALSKEDANGHFRGVGSPILFTSVGQHALGLGTPKKEVEKL